MERNCIQCSAPLPELLSKKGNPRNFPMKYCSKACADEAYRLSGRRFPEGVGRLEAARLSGPACEALTISALLFRGYEVFKAVSAFAPCDLVVLIEGRFYRVEVKAVRRRRRSGEIFNNFAEKIDPTKHDILALVIPESNEVIFQPALETLTEAA